MSQYWLDTAPSMGLPVEELRCPVGSAESALRVRGVLQDFLDTHRRRLSPSERLWLTRQIDAWRRRAAKPSAWFLLHGAAPMPRGASMSREYREALAVVRAGELVGRYESACRNRGDVRAWRHEHNTERFRSGDLSGDERNRQAGCGGAVGEVHGG